MRPIFLSGLAHIISYHIILQEQQQEYYQQNEKLRDMVQIDCRPTVIPGWAMGTDLTLPLAYILFDF